MTPPLVVLGHGASGTASSMRSWVDALAARGIDARAIDLPRGRTDPAVAVFDAAIADAARAAIADAARAAIADAARAATTDAARPVVPGGHSFGGRVASLAAAGRLDGAGQVAGVLLLSYPLHRPGDPAGWIDRTAHWPRLRCPVLLLSGESDPFARLDVLRESVRLLPDARLVTYPRVGHGLGPVLEDAADRAAEFIGSL